MVAQTYDDCDTDGDADCNTECENWCSVLGPTPDEAGRAIAEALVARHGGSVGKDFKSAARTLSMNLKVVDDDDTDI